MTRLMSYDSAKKIFVLLFHTNDISLKAAIVSGLRLAAWKIWWNCRWGLKGFQRKITTDWVLFSEGHILLIRSVSFLLDSIYGTSLTHVYIFCKFDFENMELETALHNFLTFRSAFSGERINWRMLMLKGLSLRCLCASCFSISHSGAITLDIIAFCSGARAKIIKTEMAFDLANGPH